jgi:hypothetical protein
MVMTSRPPPLTSRTLFSPSVKTSRNSMSAVAELRTHSSIWATQRGDVLQHRFSLRPRKAEKGRPRGLGWAWGTPKKRGEEKVL